MPEKSWLQKGVKALNYLSCVAMVAVAIERFRTYDKEKIYMDGFYCIFTCYLFVFALFLFSAEYEVIVILKYFACLASYWGKGAFQIFVGVLLYDYQRKLEIAASLYLVVAGTFNFLTGCCRAIQPSASDRSSDKSLGASLTPEQRQNLRHAQNAAL